MDQVFDWWVDLLVNLAGMLGITYKEINVWIFVIIWPMITLILHAIIFYQRGQIAELQNNSMD